MQINDIILNERNYIEELIDGGDLGHRPSRALSLAARLFREDGYDKEMLRPLLEELILKHNPNASLPRWSQSIDWAIRYSDKKLIQIDSIPITQLEIDICKSMDTPVKERLMFTLFVMAKFYHMANPKNQGWVNIPDGTLFKLANISVNSKRQSLMLNELMQDEYVEFANTIDNTSIKVTFMDFDSPAVMTVDDLRNIGNQYRRFCGEPYMTCENCGLTVRRKTNNQKYCKECAKKINIQKASYSSQLRRAALIQEHESSCDA